MPPATSPVPTPTSPHAHQPAVPSTLRQAQLPPSSPEDRPRQHLPVIYGRDPDDSSADTTRPTIPAYAAVDGQASPTQAQGEMLDEPRRPPPDARTALLDDGRRYHIPSVHDCGEEGCQHGTFSPRPRAQRGYGSVASTRTAGEGFGSYLESRANGQIDGVGWGKGKGNGGGEQGGWWRSERWTYLLYYLPITNWLRQYRWHHVQGDLIAALTMASFYIPMALSYASNLAHIPPINGLYSFVFNPLIYALLGTCPQMVVGPEAAGSLLLGGVVKDAITKGHHSDTSTLQNAHIAGLVTSLAGAIILAAGVFRLGFLDSVLSRPFLRGFISAIGIVILVDQLIPEMGLDTPAVHSPSAAHGSSLAKILFLSRHAREAHTLTCLVSFTTLFTVLVLRALKRRLQPRWRWIAYIPDRFALVVLSALLTRQYAWQEQGLAILGDIRVPKGKPFQPSFPFKSSNFQHVDDAFGTAFVIALLGFFESSVAAKGLGSATSTSNGNDDDGNITGVAVSANRELVALGVANMVGGVFMSLPAFGGYGRSKVNASTGGRTPMSSVFLSLITVVCVLVLLPWFYYIPKAVLSAMISSVAYTLIEEAPHDLRFFYSISGWSELALIALVFFTTFFWNLRMGIAVGIGLSLLRLLRHATRPRIQIMGRVPGTTEFENAEEPALVENLAGRSGDDGGGEGGGAGGGGVEFVPHCLIVKIPEPLTFANTGGLKDRLRRLEDHGDTATHPGAGRGRSVRNRNIIFDVHGVTSLDPAASQVLLEIVRAYIERGTRVYFCRVPGRRTTAGGGGGGGRVAKSAEVWRLLKVTGIVALCGGERAFLRSVDEALRATERGGSLMTGAERDEEAGLVGGGSGALTPEEGEARAGQRVVGRVGEEDGESGGSGASTPR
ncbi:hypothetical protein LTR08_000173 [Meristemomyces frigidus]|nr:hypothetical protein LTR08_000173 [Meristemomyces frigidus]